MKILVTGANGFIGKNLCVKLSEQKELEFIAFNNKDKLDTLITHDVSIDYVVHLAGVNRPDDDKDFSTVNAGLTAELCKTLIATNNKPHIIFASSIQAENANPYGISKRSAEKTLEEYSNATGAGVSVFRLPNVFGKWCRPDYNSVVATFCHNIARGLEINIHNPETTLTLVYIDDVINAFLATMNKPDSIFHFAKVNPAYQIQLGELAELLYKYRDSRDTLVIEKVGTGLNRALYATYLSYLEPEYFSYPLVSHDDERGRFVELLKTQDSGQFSFFTAGPGVTRGGHYHHTKNEKFLLVQGLAKFRFRHIATGEYFETSVSSEKPEVVETIPGWVHDITNIGKSELIVLLWANEIFDTTNPDTIGAPVHD